ncbi:hypothetical protein N3K66_008579 [Trichothecium roseum]|uniref:Uncharacterized protein n=1 Tax=Trichothecium roseum TaxID=47278 RepID=A0ACC0UR38_9HYPO|nr:hypothetical protein N3K66_008579 [Trichothecium roseum]
MSLLNLQRPVAAAASLRGLYRPTVPQIPQQRVVVYRQPLAPGSKRRFGTEVAAAFNQTVNSVAQVVSSVHHVAGVPWYITIPLFATAVNVVVRFPVQRANHKRALVSLDTFSVKAAWSSRIYSLLARNPKGRPSAEQMRKLAEPLVAKRWAEVDKEFGCQSWKTYASGLSAMVPFILASEALRRLAGYSRYLSAEMSAASFDQSLTQGGLAWFQDLTVMDPYYVLPAMCSAVLAADSWFGVSRERIRELLHVQPSTALPQTLQQRLANVFGRLQLAMPFLPLAFSHFPSVIFLYWLTTFSMNRVNRFFIQRLHPRRKDPLKEIATNAAKKQEEKRKEGLKLASTSVDAMTGLDYDESGKFVRKQK